MTLTFKALRYCMC